MSARSPYSPRSNPRSPWAHLDVSNQHASPLSRENSLRRGSGTYWEAEDLLHRSTSGDVFARSPGGVSPVVGAGDDDDDGLQDLLSGSVYHGNGTGPLPQEELDIASSPKPSLFKQLSSSKLGQLLRKKKRRREKEQLQADAAAADFKSNGSSHSPRRAPRKGSGSAATLTLPSSAYDPTNPYSPTSPFPPRGGYVLYTRRWFVLALFSALAFMNRVICFTYAPVSHLADDYYKPPIHLSWMIDVFFVSYCVSALPAARLVDEYGLRPCVIFSAWLQALGCGLRVLTIQEHESADFWLAMLGQILAALAQCVLINSPPLLSSLWFGEDEHVTATTIAVESNVLGVAGAYIAGPLVVHTADDVFTLELYMALATLVLAVLAVFFPAAPPTPPTRSSHVKEAGTKVESFVSMMKLFLKKGFVHTVVSSAVGDMVVNVFSTFLTTMLITKDFSLKAIGWLGSFFVLSGIMGCAVVGWLVDRTKYYQTWMVVVCSVCTAFLVLWTLLDEATSPNHVHIVVVLLCIGFFVGPLEPLSIEIAAECTFPASESTFAAIQQLAGNLGSAAAVPLVVALKSGDDMTKPNWMLVGLSAFTAVTYLTFNGEYIRMDTEERRKLLMGGARASDGDAAGGAGGAGVKAHRKKSASPDGQATRYGSLGQT